ncbi:MAG TPA: 50S ribosomal protein L29 [candidate division Zixibacteria bacterium]|nr:50S ribosomal protein L29 [candidate division Zixibacteria bacterium]
MTVVRVESLRELTREELEQKKSELADEQFNLRMRQSLKALDNPLRLRHIRREIAQIMTVLREDSLNIKKLAETKTTVLGEASPKKKAKKK